MRIDSTKNLSSSGINCLIYGHSGAGKTSLIKTLPEEGTLILDAEAGLLPLAGMDYSVIHISSMEDFKEAYGFIMENQKSIKNLVVDSISEIAEIVLADAKTKNKDGRMAYMDMGDAINSIIRQLRDIKTINTFFIAKMERVQDDTGKLVYSPSIPGQKAAKDLPYPFDEVMVLRVDYDSDSQPIRHLQTTGDDRYIAKDRSGKLAYAEEADLSIVLAKIGGQHA